MSAADWAIVNEMPTDEKYVFDVPIQGTVGKSAFVEFMPGLGAVFLLLATIAGIFVLIGPTYHRSADYYRYPIALTIAFLTLYATLMALRRDAKRRFAVH